MLALIRSCLKRDLNIVPDILKYDSKLSFTLVISFDLYFLYNHLNYFVESLVQCSAGIRSAAKHEPKSNHQEREPAVSPKVRFKYPEFLPHPNTLWRHPIREKLERRDMINRRNHITIPEFYVGGYYCFSVESII